MPANEWDAAYRQPRAGIEHQHQLLVDLADALALERTGKAQLEAMALQLYRQVRMHFDFEEELMRSVKYPAMLEHTAAHLELVNRLNSLWEPKGLHEFVADTLMQHIHEYDDRLSDYLAETPKSSAEQADG